MSAPTESVAILMVSFGEPDELTMASVRSYLERIFLQNVDLESGGAEWAAERSARLAAARAPGLLEEYHTIGGSPLNAQSAAQAAALQEELGSRGWRVQVHSAFQFTAPTIAERVAEARTSGADHLVVLPVYPLCGQSTTVATISRVRATLDDMGWSPDFTALSGWHQHPAYVALRVENIRDFIRGRGLDLTDPDTLLYFSVHGTPISYLDRGNRYDRYVEEHTRAIATALGMGVRYAVGFQNHTNRGIQWTQPDNEDCIRSVAERRLVVVPISFMHEQSETLAELDQGLRAFAEGHGKEFHRVPIPHGHPDFVRFLADLVSMVLRRSPEAGRALSRCRCCLVDGTWCANGGRDLPPSPYGPGRRQTP